MIRSIAVVAAVAGLAYLAQGPSSPALSHFALVKSLANGTAEIDETRHETGSQETSDFAYFDGHYYANKTPGLAFIALPVYAVLSAAGLDDPDVMLWALGLVGALLPATLLILLVRRLGDRLEPGFGTAAALTLGLGTLLTTFATVFFPHALSALLVFAAFVLLFAERQGQPRLALIAGAGALAGYAVTTEYHNVFAGVILGLYALARPGRLRRGLAYSAAVVVGLLPLLAYNLWAFGSPTHLTYEGTVLVPGASGHDVLFDVGSVLGLPDLSTAVSLLFSRWGLVTTAPVLAMGIVGLVLFYRRGNRAEALVMTAIPLAYLLYSASYYEPFGQVPPGPRFLLPMLPFLALPLALSFRAFPFPTAVLAVVSVGVACAVAVTRPHIAWDGDLLFRLVHPSWWSPMLPDLAGLHASYRVVPFVAAIAVAIVCAVLATPRPAVRARRLLGAAQH